MGYVSFLRSAAPGWRSVALFLLLAIAFLPHAVAQAASATLNGTVTDPTGAVIPNARVSVTTPDGHTVATATSNGAGSYQAGNLARGTYIVIGSAKGFATSASKAVMLTTGQSKQFNVTLQIAVVKQQVQVTTEPTTVSTSPSNNANAIVIQGKDLNALSDDPDELQSELQALAGPAAGPNGGQIYIDGFSGGQLPPKSSIREIKINQNPFSAEFDRLGYGRIEIFTKPGTDKLHGQIESRGNDSSFNSPNPILNANLQPGEPLLTEPAYYSYNFNGSVSGPLSKSSSFIFSMFGRNNQNESIVDATNPLDTSETLNEAISNPSSRIDIRPRVDFQVGAANTLTIQDDFFRAVDTNTGVGAQDLPSQAMNSHSFENTLQVSDSIAINKNLADDIRFQYIRFRSQALPESSAPAVTAESAFTTGGSNAGTTEDHQDDYELQNYFTQAAGSHSLSYGARLRAYRDANYSNPGANSSYLFAPTPTGCAPSTTGCTALMNYQNQTPQQYTVTLIHNSLARAILFDAGLFYQDDWKVNPRLTFSYGTRWEAQNRINDKDDWAPRVMIAYGLDGSNGKPTKTVLRTGYGWFYQRFTVPNGTTGTPYLIQAIHNNFVPLGSSQVANEQVITVDNPNFYNPNQAVTSFTGSTSPAAPTGYSLDPHFRSALDMQAAVGIDRQLSKLMTANVTYLYSRGVHQYLTDNVSAAGLFPEQDALSDTYPTGAVPVPMENNMQFQAGGVYRQNQVIGSITARYTHFSIVSFYTYNNAKGDTNGVGSVPSVASDPGLDYGRTPFDIHNRFLILGNFDAPWQLSFAPFLSVNSGTPYNITTGTDLTGNNQFNARPTFAASCSEANVVVTPYGCLDKDPVAGEKIVPFGLGTGPTNVSVNLRIAKIFGFGPKVEGGGGGGGGGGRGGGRGGLGPGGLVGGGGGGFRGIFNTTTPRKYNLTIEAYGQNIFNHENLGVPNGTIGPFFGKSQTLAGGFFGQATAGNRSVFLAANFSF